MYGRAGFELLKARVRALGCPASSLTFAPKVRKNRIKCYSGSATYSNEFRLSAERWTGRE
jgi:hypothetical protein